MQKYKIYFEAYDAITGHYKDYECVDAFNRVQAEFLLRQKIEDAYIIKVEKVKVDKNA
jgi:hypothetical protein